MGGLLLLIVLVFFVLAVLLVFVLALLILFILVLLCLLILIITHGNHLLSNHWYFYRYSIVYS